MSRRSRSPRFALLAILSIMVTLVGMSRSVARASSARQGVDVSSWQGSINWASVASSGISFAYIRAGEGTGSPDSNFQVNWNRALAAGVTPGAYLFFHPSEDPNAQAQLLIRQLESVPFGRGDLIPAIDVETTDNQSQATVVTALQTLVHGVQAAIGALPAIYASPSWWDDYVNSSAFTADPLWLACWCSGGNPPGPAHNWGGFGWQAWQYTDAGSVPGVAGPVDL